MFRFIALRVVQFPLIVALIYVLTFTLVWVAPGDPFTSNDRSLSPEVVKSLRERFHAETWHGFLLHYPQRVLIHGDFGPSMSGQAFTANDKLGSGLPVSVSLGAAALALSTLFGVLIGTLAALRRGSIVDYASNVAALVGISIPSFVVAGLLATLAYQFIDVVRDPLLQWWFPVLALALMPTAYIARLMRVSMMDVLTHDCVRTARAKGVGRTAVIWKHCFRNACLPIISFLAPAAAATLTGSFVVEKVFNIAGLSRHFVDAVLGRDSTVILAVVMVYSTMLVALNLVADILYSVADPRIQYGSKR